MRYRRWAGIGSSLLLGIIFILSGVGKIADPSGFLTALNYTFLSPNLGILIAYWLPWIELVLGLYLVTGIFAKIFSSVSGFLVTGFIIHNIWLMTHGLATEDCGCFGGIENILKIERQITLSAQGALYMDAGMLVLLLIILFYYPGKYFSLEPWWWSSTRRKSNSGNSEAPNAEQGRFSS